MSTMLTHIFAYVGPPTVFLSQDSKIVTSIYNCPWNLRLRKSVSAPQQSVTTVARGQVPSCAIPREGGGARGKYSSQVPWPTPWWAEPCPRAGVGVPVVVSMGICGEIRCQIDGLAANTQGPLRPGCGARAAGIWRGWLYTPPCAGGAWPHPSGRGVGEPPHS